MIKLIVLEYVDTIFKLAKSFVKRLIPLFYQSAKYDAEAKRLLSYLRPGVKETDHWTRNP